MAEQPILQLPKRRRRRSPTFAGWSQHTLIHGMSDLLGKAAARPEVRVGLIVATWSSAATFARGLLPRSSTDQALLTGFVSAAQFQLAVTVDATAMSFASGLTGIPRTTVRGQVVAGVAAGAVGAALVAGTAGAGSAPAVGRELARASAERPGLATSATRALGQRMLATGLAELAVAGSDELLHRRLGLRRNAITTFLLDAAVGGTVTAARVVVRQRRARALAQALPAQAALCAGAPEPEARARAARLVIRGRQLSRDGAVGAVTASGVLGLAAAEQILSGAVARAVSRTPGEDPGALAELLGHIAATTAMGAASSFALDQLRRRVQRHDDIVEAAYPGAPTNRHVTAGPASTIEFDTIGKEGRRFVVMALTGDEITAVTGRPARAEPVRIVGGFKTSRSIAERAARTLAELDALRGLERALVVVAAPTGVGYMNYSVAEALEYLTDGDTTIVVPQYALVPSILALTSNREGAALQRLVFEGIAERVAAMPLQRRPRVVSFGESLGAQVALDAALVGSRGVGRLFAGREPAPDAAARQLDALGIDAGLYLGVPFFTGLWKDWRDEPSRVDPDGLLLQASSAREVPGARAELARRPSSVRPGRHVILVHHDDPVNLFDLGMLVRAPWWLGPPDTRPPKVPRETRFRPLVTFAATLVDVKNGMNSKPGHFTATGHDYRGDIVNALVHAYELPSDDALAARIDSALRQREREWAVRRLVAGRFDRARQSIQQTLTRWGDSVLPINLPDLPDIRTLLPSGASLPGAAVLGSRPRD